MADTHVHDPVISDARVRHEASQVRFLSFTGSIVRTSLLFAFTAVGWIFGSAWFLLVYAAISVKYGFMQGAHVKVPPPKQPSLPQ